MLFRIFIRKCSSHVGSATHFSISTPIFYVNASPHIGHLYSSIIADAVHRFTRLQNPKLPTLFCTGTDEHGLKIAQAAKSKHIGTSEYCSQISQEYSQLGKEFNVNTTDFVRTTEQRHQRAVQHLWTELVKRGHIYSSNYAGWYCISDETFLTETQIKSDSDGRKFSIESGHPVEWSEETNYMFRLGQFRDDIVSWIKQGNRIKPKVFEKILLDTLHESLPDLSVSRPTSRVAWAIGVPGDDSQSIYVWLDALTNYLTCAGYPDEKFHMLWPPTVHVLGKDILKFHGIYWPAFCLAAGIEPPNQLLVHSHWTVDGQKMSKSKANVVDPRQRAQLYTAAGLRYFLLREGVAHNDGNYSDLKVTRILNAELADTLGNLLSRVCAHSLNPQQLVPQCHPSQLDQLKQLEVTQKLITSLASLPEYCDAQYREYNFHLVVDGVMATLHLANNFVETSKPWTLKNSKTLPDRQRLETILRVSIEVLHICGIILQPIVPDLMDRLLDKLNVESSKRNWQDSQLRIAQLNDSRPLGDGNPVLFRRILSEKSRAEREARIKVN